jgi:colanic acid biosynthesis glycosyl transferase WcaI
MFMKKERILLLSGNYYPEPTGIGKYNGEMMDWLSGENYECRVITTYPYYPYWDVQVPYKAKSFWYRKETLETKSKNSIIIYRCPHYVPRIPTGINRILSDFSYFLSAFFQIVRILFRKKFDYLIIVAPPFQLGILGLLYKKIKGAKLIYHIQDMQIDAAVELGMIKSKSLIKLFFSIERFILCRADFVSSISEGMIRKIRKKFKRPIILFPNWTDTKTFYPIYNKNLIDPIFNFLTTDKIILYSGSIGEKQGLQAILQAAHELKDLIYIKFIICGSGPYKERLVKKAKEMSLINLKFLPLQPVEIFNQLLNRADVHLILQKTNTNDLFMPSKLSTIFSVGGLAVVTATENTSLHSIILNNNIGILVEPENQKALTDTIKTAICQPYDEIKNNARNFACNNLSLSKVVSTYFSEIITPLKTKPPVLSISNEHMQHSNT